MLSQTLLKVSSLKVSLDGATIFENLDFEVNKGETLVILGPNGAGKTVLLKTLLGMFPFEGSIEWRKGTKKSYVPQRVHIKKDIPVTVSNFFGLKGISLDKSQEILDKMGLKTKWLMQQQLGTLSTGQLQRILIAWAVASKPDVYLLDEAMAGVDITGEDIIHSFLHKNQKETNHTSILVTHDLSMVYGEATKVLCLNRNRYFIGSAVEVMDPKKLADVYGHEINYVRHNHG